MKISELSEKSGFPIDTIRYYEKRGLLTAKHVTRLPNNYRDYTDVAVLRLRLIRWGKTLGFSLAEIQAGIDEWESDTVTVERKIEAFCEKLADIDAQMDELAQMRVYVEEKLHLLRTGQTERWAQITDNV